MIPPIRRWPVPVECATPPRPPRCRTPGPGRGPRPPSWQRLPTRFAHPSPAAPAPTPRTRTRTAPILPHHRAAPGPPRDPSGEKGSVSLSHRERRSVGPDRHDGAGGRGAVRAGPPPQSAPTATGPLLRRDVHFALENDGWNCTFECEVHVSAPGGVADRPENGVIAAAAVRAGVRVDPPGARGGAVCPNLPQRPGSRRSTERVSLIFRAFIRGRSRPGAPLWQIWTRPRPGPPQEPHAHHHALAHSRHRADPDPRPAAPDEKDPLTPFPGCAGAVVCPKVTRRPPFPPRRRHPANSARSCRPPGPTAAARLSPPGRRCGRWDP